MKKRYILLTLAAAVISLAAQASNMRIGFVNLNYVLANAKQNQQINVKLQSEFQQRKQQVEALSQQVKALYSRGEKNHTTMSEQEKIDLRRQYNAKQAELDLAEKAYNEDLQRRLAEEQNNLLSQVQQAINQLAASGHYDMIVKKDALFWASDATDLSKQVVDIVNK